MLKSNSDERNNAAALSLCYVETPAPELFRRGIFRAARLGFFRPYAEKIPISCLCLVHFETDKKNRDNGRAQCTSALPYHSIHPALRRLSTPAETALTDRNPWRIDCRRAEHSLRHGLRSINAV
jgi:hypothetical protein